MGTAGRGRSLLLAAPANFVTPRSHPPPRSSSDAMISYPLVALAPDPRHPGELLRNEVAGAAAEARAWVGGGADVPEAWDLSRVPGSRRQRAPKEVLVELCRAAVRVAGHRIGVVGD